MGGILLQAMLKHGILSRELTCATVQHEERARALSTKLTGKFTSQAPPIAPHSPASILFY